MYYVHVHLLDPHVHLTIVTNSLLSFFWINLSLTISNYVAIQKNVRGLFWLPAIAIMLKQKTIKELNINGSVRDEYCG
jgi:hypothetical protein